MVSHRSSSNLHNLCDNIKNNADFPGFTHVEFDKLGKVEMNKVEEFVYKMMTIFKTTPIELSNSLPKSLYDRVEQRWSYSLTTKRNIRENTLARVMQELDKSSMS